MLAPNAKAKYAHAAKGQNHEALHPYRLAGKRGDQMGDESEARKHGDVDFGLCKEPEQAPPEHRKKIRDEACGLTGKKIQRRKKVGAQKTVR